MFEQLLEVGPGGGKRRQGGKDGMLDWSVTGFNHRSLISLSNSPGFVHLEVNTPSSACVCRVREPYVCPTVPALCVIFE